MKCRLCKSTDLYPFLDLGLHPPSDQFRVANQLCEQVIYYPLVTCVCENCGFIQLSHVVDPKILYQDNYPYESSTTEIGKLHFYEFAKNVAACYQFGPSDLAVDIGSNVGVLLNGFKSLGLKVQGVEPAKNIAVKAEANGIPTISNFFNLEVASEILASKGPASVICATNVFAHIDDLDSFVSAIKFLLNPSKGVFVIEAPHFLRLIANIEYDTIYHEHLSYITIEPLRPYFEKFGLEIIKIEEKDIHGGSIRISVAYKGVYPVDQSVQKIVDQEINASLRSRASLTNFSKKVQETKFRLQKLLLDLKQEGKRIVVVSAPAKGMTLLNYCKLDRQIIDYATEKSKLKIGLFTPGGNIPVYPDEKLLQDQPDYALLLAWNFAEEIIANNSEFIRRGGRFIIPIPYPKII